MSNKGTNLVCAHIEDSDQAANVRSLIRVFVGRDMRSQYSNVTSGVKVRRQSDLQMRRLI